MKIQESGAVQQLLIAAFILLIAGGASASPIYTHFEFGERYSKAARSVVPGFGVFSKTELPPVNVAGWTKPPKNRKSASEVRKNLTRFEAPAKTAPTPEAE